MRKRSVVAPDWWDYTTISDELVADVAKLTVKDMEQLSRPGFKVVMYDTIEEFYMAEALENPRLTIPAASAAPSAPPSSCPWWPAWSMPWI